MTLRYVWWTIEAGMKYSQPKVAAICESLAHFQNVTSLSLHDTYLEYVHSAFWINDGNPQLLIAAESANVPSINRVSTGIEKMGGGGSSKFNAWDLHRGGLKWCWKIPVKELIC